jgi:hypothetical protein
MNEDKAQKLIILATFVTLGSTIGAAAKKPKSMKTEIKIRRAVVGGFFAMMICSFIAEANTEIGVGLAATVAGTTFFQYGLPVLNESFGETKWSRNPAVRKKQEEEKEGKK